ncbi:MAG: response regulator [Salinibacterium sp.]|nr:response regulator [Salinibacterium sp.]
MRATEVDRVKVLVVEDSEDQAGLLLRYFERAGCIVTLVQSAEEAITAYQRERHDLAVIDLQLPGMDGWQLATKLKSERPACAIAITSVLDASDFPIADATLPKPFTGAQVRQVLEATVPRWVEL